MCGLGFGVSVVVVCDISCDGFLFFSVLESLCLLLL